MAMQSDNEAEQVSASVADFPDVDPETALKERFAELTGLLEEQTTAVARWRGGKADRRGATAQNEIKGIQEQLGIVETALDAIQQAQRLRQRFNRPPSEVTATATVASAPTSPTVRFPQGLPKFRTGTEGIHNPRDLLDQFELIMHGHDLNTDQYWHRFFPCCLPPNIAKWMVQRVPSTCSWEEAKK
jgi:hypothetical protein